MSNSAPSLARVVVAIEEATQKCIRKLRVEEPHANSEEPYAKNKGQDDQAIGM
jgi:hypothetical protein